MDKKVKKPTGGKNYGSIPHLPGSRLGAGDHHCHEGQARIATERVRDKHDVYLPEVSGKPIIWNWEGTIEHFPGAIREAEERDNDGNN